MESSYSSYDQHQVLLQFEDMGSKVKVMVGSIDHEKRLPAALSPKFPTNPCQAFADTYLP